jgi:hypothetical protein
VSDARHDRLKALVLAVCAFLLNMGAAVSAAAVVRWVGELGIPEADWRRTRSRVAFGDGATLPADGVAIRSPVTLYRVEVSRIQ